MGTESEKQDSYREEPKVGPTGRYPNGKLNSEDKGELRSAIGIVDNTIVIKFGATVSWLALNKKGAQDMVNKLNDLISKLK